ncbi:MAG: hypothetical protein WC001_04020 [Desulfurivibrionaceae bacterium]
MADRRYPITSWLSFGGKLLAKFSNDYAAYLGRTPRFIPNPRLLREPEFYEVSVRVFKRYTLDATMFIWFYLLFHFIKKLQFSVKNPSQFYQIQANIFIWIPPHS